MQRWEQGSACCRAAGIAMEVHFQFLEDQMGPLEAPLEVRHKVPETACRLGQHHQTPLAAEHLTFVGVDSPEVVIVAADSGVESFHARGAHWLQVRARSVHSFGTEGFASPASIGHQWVSFVFHRTVLRCLLDRGKDVLRVLVGLPIQWMQLCCGDQVGRDLLGLQGEDCPSTEIAA